MNNQKKPDLNAYIDERAPFRMTPEQRSWCIEKYYESRPHTPHPKEDLEKMTDRDLALAVVYSMHDYVNDKNGFR